MAGDSKEWYRELEEQYADFVGHRYGVSVNTGTAALHLSLAALGIGPGDEVIVPDFTMVACAYAVLYTGATPVFVDCKDDLLINEDRIEEKLSFRTKAIMPVHIYGRVCNMKAINDIASRYNLFVIEDACEAQGAKVGDATVTCCSFYKNKIIHAEEGGMITTNNEALADKMRDMKCMSFGDKHDFNHGPLGFNYRMPDSQAKMTLESLAKVDENLAKRRQISAWFDKYLPEEWKMPEREVVWVHDFLPLDKEAVISKLTTPYREFFKPMSKQPFCKTKYYHPEAERFGERGLYFPVYPDMTEEHVKEVTKNLTA